MAKHCPENEAIKRKFSFWLQTAGGGKQASTVDAKLRSIARFEESTGYRPFSKFHAEQARAFHATLQEPNEKTGKPLSAATITSTLKDVREFFVWLAREAGYMSKIKTNDAKLFTPSAQDLRIASAKREGPVASVEEVVRVLKAMPFGSPVEKRNKALVALALVTGARNAALSSLRLKHVNLESQSVFQDGRVVKTKGRKTFTTTFFQVGPEPVEVITAYVEFLTNELGFKPDDPLFPSTANANGENYAFVAAGLSRKPWASTEPVRRIFRAAFEAVGLPYSNPHSIRKTLVRHGQQICTTPEEWKCWSQNLGHESEATTFVGYGAVPLHRQAEVIASLGTPRRTVLPLGVDIAALKAFVQSVEESGAER
jgi:integrase/recombinase XerD